MGLLDKFTGRNKPEYKKALELETERIRKEGEVVSAQMQEHFRQRREAQDAEHQRIIAEKDKEIDELLNQAGISRDELKKRDKQE